MDPPDLIMADWILPDGKGIDILSRDPDGMVTIPLVIITGYGDERLAVEIMKSGAIDYVVKSGSVFDQLPFIARRALREWENIRKRRTAENAARESAKRLADIISFLPDAVLAIDNNGRVIAWNRAMEEITGITAAEMLGKENYEYSLPFYGERRPILIDLVLQDDPDTEGKYLHVKHNGDKIIGEAFNTAMFGGRGAFLWGTASPLYDSSGSRVGAIEVVRDITARKRNEEKLARNENTLKTLLNAPHDTIALLDRNGRIIDINTEGAHRLGGTIETLTGCCIFDLLPPDLAATRKGYIEYVFSTGRPVLFEDERSGICFRNEMYPILGENATLVERVAVFARDITGEKEAGHAIAQSEDRFRRISSLTTDFAYSCRCNSAGIISLDWMSGAVVAMTGYTDDELRAMGTWGALVEQEDRSLFDEMMTGTPMGQSSNCELRIRAKDGRIRWLRCFTECVEEPAFPGSRRVFGGCRDITLRRNATLALRESEEKYRQIVENSHEAIFVIEDGIVRFANSACEDILRLPVRAIVGRNFTDFVPPEEREEILDIYGAILTSAGRNLPLPRRYQRGDGTLGWLDINAVRITWKSKPATLNFAIDVSEQKRARDALKENEQKFRTVADYTYDWEYWIHPDGTYKYISPSCERISGYSRDEFYKNPDLLKDIVYPDDREKFLEHMEKDHFGSNAAQAFDFRITAKSGEMIWIGHLCHPIFSEEGSFLGRRASNRDITKRREAETALLESETRFRALVQNSSDIIRILSPEGLIVYESPSSERILGYPCGSLVGKNPMDYIHPEDLDLVKTDLREVFEKTNPGTPTEFRIRKADGNYLWVDSLAVNLLGVPGVNGIVVTTRPIEQRKQMEIRLAESEARLRLAMEGAEVASWDWNLATHQIYFSNKFYSMLGYEPSEIPQDFHAWARYIHPDDRDRITPELRQQILQNRPLCEFESRFLNKEGNWIWILSRGSIAETDSQGNAVRITGVNIDITNRKLMESEVRSLNLVLEQRVKDRTEDLRCTNKTLQEEVLQRQVAEEKLRQSLEQKTILLKEVHHRVKNNLQIIASLLNLQSRYIHDDSTLAAIRESQNRVRAMALVHEKLYRSDDLARIDLSDYLQYLGAGLLQFYDAKMRGIRFDHPPSGVSVNINAAIPLGLIVNELISNSLKYAFPEERTGEISILVNRDDHTIRIDYCDNGIGIPECLDWRNTQSLGLRLVNSLVDQLGGTIDLECRGGTQFHIRVPEKE